MKYKTYSDNQLHRQANKYRPHGTSSFKAIEVGSTLKNIAAPARRHRCEVCRRIFECHLCSMTEDHILHHRSRHQDYTAVFVCEDCIERHELYVVPCSIPLKRRGVPRSPSRVTFWDHATGLPIVGTNRAHKHVVRRLTWNGETLTIGQWAKRLGVHHTVIRERLYIGWETGRAVTTPVRRKAS